MYENNSREFSKFKDCSQPLPSYNLIENAIQSATYVYTGLLATICIKILIISSLILNSILAHSNTDYRIKI